MDKKIIEGFARVGEGKCGSFLPKEKLKIPMKTIFCTQGCVVSKDTCIYLTSLTYVMSNSSFTG